MLIGATITWDANATGYRGIGIHRNGGEVVYESHPSASGSLATHNHVSVPVEASAGDTITVHARQIAGASLNLVNSDGYSGRLSCKLWVIVFEEF
jgi:hypothetical protein